MFHFACLNQYAQKLPANTAPAGYTCPTCNAGIFPPSNLASPVADVLREILSKVNWARAGLGLPLVNIFINIYWPAHKIWEGAQWLIGTCRVLDLILKGHRFESCWRHCIVSLSNTLYPLLCTGSTQEYNA